MSSARDLGSDWVFNSVGSRRGRCRLAVDTGRRSVGVASSSGLDGVEALALEVECYGWRISSACNYLRRRCPSLQWGRQRPSWWWPFVDIGEKDGAMLPLP